MKNYILDNLPSIWIVLVFILGLTLAAGNVKAEHKKLWDRIIASFDKLI